MLVATIVLASAIGPPAALADADPASDVLLGANVFYPYSPPVSGALERSLNGLTAGAARGHFPIKVALIDAPTDLGGLPSFFGKPQPYARFLDQEIGVIGTPHPPLLVVMPDGYGGAGLPPRALAAVGSLAKPAGGQSDGLAQSAIVAVQKLAAAAGYRLAKVSGASSGSGGPSAALVAALAVAAVAAAATIIVIRRRRGP